MSSTLLIPHPLPLLAMNPCWPIPGLVWVLAPSLDPTFVLQIPFVAQCESSLRVSHGYTAYAKLGPRKPKKQWYLMNQAFALDIVFWKLHSGCFEIRILLGKV